MFSSRGPNGAVADIIKPDVTAPGVQILAGNSPTPFIGAPGQLFQAIQGTSMSSPHVAGVGALLVGRASRLDAGDGPVGADDDRLTRTSTRRMARRPPTRSISAAGHIQRRSRPNDPGLVYDAGFDDYFRVPLRRRRARPAAARTAPRSGRSIRATSTWPRSASPSSPASRRSPATVTNVGPRGDLHVDGRARPPGVTVGGRPAVDRRSPRARRRRYTVTFTATPAATLDDVGLRVADVERRRRTTCAARSPSGRCASRRPTR